MLLLPSSCLIDSKMAVTVSIIRAAIYRHAVEDIIFHEGNTNIYNALN